MIVYKAGAGNGDNLEFVLSDATVDSYGDVIDPNGWDLKSFKKNPIALFGHSSGFPIGTWSSVRVEGGRLLGKLNLAARGTSARIDELIALVEQGILRAVSVGFVPIKSDPLDPEKPYGPQRYIRQELRECSLVSVPANPAALAVAKSLNVSEETMSLAFGEQAGMRRRDVTTIGGTAVKKSIPERNKVMTTLAQRIENAQNDLNAKRDRLAELTAVDDMDTDAVTELTAQVDGVEKSLMALKAAEQKIGIAASSTTVAAPAIARKPLGFPQKEVRGFDLLVRAATVNVLSKAKGKTLDKVLDEAYPGHEATALIAKADQTIGTTTVSGWASELFQTVNADFLQALTGFSIYPALKGRGIDLSAQGASSVAIPRRTGGTAGGGWVAEGSPIKVAKLTTAASSLTPKKMGVIVAYSDELGERSIPAIEGLVRRAILEDTAATLDSALLDATAVSTARPAGLLNGVSAAASGYGGGDHEAVKADFKALLAPFITANAADSITVIMNPSQGLSIAMMDGPANNTNWFGEIRARVNIVESTYATANRLIAIRNSDFATMMGDVPRFDVSQQAVIHMEDTTPLEIVSGTGPTTADPVRSLWQTASTGIRMILPVSWTMARTGMVQWIDTTSY
jgi:HK97 family phage prohead protease/HK97 family phage major capsid protein